MPKVLEEKSSKKQEDEKKSRKKLAKREAELMLEAERAKKDLHKAEQKLAKAQSALEAAQAELQGTETKLATLRLPDQDHSSASNGSVQPVEQSTPPLSEGADSEHEGGQEIPSVEQVAGPPPVEGRSDIVQDTEPATSPDEPLKIASGEGSILIQSNDEHAWPPPEIREELADAIHQEERDQPGVAEESTSVDGVVGEAGEEEDGASSTSETPVAQNTRRRGSRRS